MGVEVGLIWSRTNLFQEQRHLYIRVWCAELLRSDDIFLYSIPFNSILLYSTLSNQYGVYVIPRRK